MRSAGAMVRHATRFATARRSFGALLLAASLAAPAISSANPDALRLRGDVFATAQAPTGLLILGGRAEPNTWADAEALVWAGRGELGAEADALVASVRLRDPDGRGELRLGRLLLATGTIRPIHLDGAAGLARTPWGTTVELFGGMPVTPRFGGRAWDWAAGGRVAQRLFGAGTLGASYVQRREAGALSMSEVGSDLNIVPFDGLDIGARVAWDLQNPGISEALGSVAVRAGDLRFDAFASRRSPSRILPATSLFTVLGDVTSDHLGMEVLWYAAPRLDLTARGGVRTYQDALGEDLLFRALLRLDDRGTGSLGLELRRQGGPEAAWSGVRGTARVPITETVAAAVELELVRPDGDRGRGRLWPWGLVGMTWAPWPEWVVAAAAEARSTPEHAQAVDALVRVSHVWSGP